ncbi:uncharacterized protein DDB_G0289917-like [Cydia fagiglandana]|uniref:uncharacterized protein DDB_G0289917-like n=1 Tax=Cydia fagiglandana TaxID=1458189 RepID=UPI002FEE546E
MVSEDESENEEERHAKDVAIIGSIKPLKIDSQVPEKWRIWKQKFEIYTEANKLDDFPENRKVAILLNLLGDEGLTIFNSFSIDRKTATLKEVIEKFDAKFNPLKNLTVERYNFFSRQQNSDEDFEEYVTVITNLSNYCEFGTLKESLIKDKFVIGISDKKVKQRLLQEDNLTIEKCLKIAKSMKLSQERSSKINNNENQTVDSVSKSYRQQHRRNSSTGRSMSQSRRTSTSNGNNHYRRENRSPSNNYRRENRSPSNTRTSTCTRCGQIHRFRCPAKGVTCRICKRSNHYEKCCFFNKNVNMVTKYPLLEDAT